MRYLLTTLGVMYTVAAVLYFPPFGSRVKDLARIIFWFASTLFTIICVCGLVFYLLGDTWAAKTVGVIALLAIAPLLRIPFARIASDIPTGNESKET